MLPLSRSSKFVDVQKLLINIGKRSCSTDHKASSAFMHLIKLFCAHREVPLPEINKIVSWNSRIPSICEVNEIALGPNPFESKEVEVKQLIQESIVDTMKKIENRISGSRKGVMYEATYFKEVAKDADSFGEHEIMRVKGELSREYPSFNTKHFCHFIKKDGIAASDAIHAFFEGPTAADCGSLSEAVYLNAIRHVLKEDKFNKLFSGPDNPLEIKFTVSSFDASSLYPFLEFVNPNIHHDTDENKLQIGDHVCVIGAPWCSLKHPSGFMNNMHGIIVGFNQNNEPLISSLEMKTPLPIKVIYDQLAFSSNMPRVEDDFRYIYSLYGDDYLSEQHIASYFNNNQECKNLTKSDILKSYTVKEIQKFGGCKVLNSSTNRLSPYILSALLEAPVDSNLHHELLLRKSVVLYKTIYNDEGIAKLGDRMIF